MFGLEWLNKDDVGFAVVGKHDVLVTTTRADVNAAYVVGEELTDGSDPNMEFIGLDDVGKRAFDTVDG